MNALNPLKKLRLRNGVLREVALRAARHAVVYSVSKFRISPVNTVSHKRPVGISPNSLKLCRRCSAVKTVLADNSQHLFACEPKFNTGFGAAIKVDSVHLIENRLTRRLTPSHSGSTCGFKLKASAALRRSPGRNSFSSTVAPKPETAVSPMKHLVGILVLRHLSDNRQPAEAVTRTDQPSFHARY